MTAGHGTVAPIKRAPKSVQKDRQQAAMRHVIERIRMGDTREQAMAFVGRSPATLRTWLTQNTRFAVQYKQAREAARRDRLGKKLARKEWQSSDFEPVVPSAYSTWASYQVAFRKAYFGRDTPDHQWMMLEAYERAIRGITAVLIPPYGGKTTLLIDTAIGDLCAFPSLRRGFISEASDVATKMMGRIQRLLSDENEGSPLFRHFGPFQPPTGDRSRKWNTQELTILNNTADQQDPNIFCTGMKGQIRNRRWDKADVDDPQSQTSLGDTEKLIAIFRGDILTRPGSAGAVRCTGSRVGRGDFWEALEREDIVDEWVTIPALDAHGRTYFPLMWVKDDEGNDTDTPVIDESGTQLGWSEEMLARQKLKVGLDQWARVYMQRPLSQHSAMVSEADIANATDRGRRPGQSAGVASMGCLDPALAGYAAYTMLGYDAERMYVLDVRNRHGVTTHANLFGEIEQLSARYRPDLWIIEENALQEGYLTDDAFLAMKERCGFDAIGHHSSATKGDDMIGIPAMMAAIVRGEIRFPAIDGENPDHWDFATLYDQLMSWRPDIPAKRLVQDMVMSLWFGYKHWRGLRDLLSMDPEGWRREGLTSVTGYAYAHTNVTITPAVAPRTHQTYTQQWDDLVKAGRASR